MLDSDCFSPFGAFDEPPSVFGEDTDMEQIGDATAAEIICEAARELDWRSKSEA